MACPSMSKAPAMTREPVDPVMAVTGEGLPVVAVDVELDAVAVVFDFVNPLSPRRSFHLQGRKLGADKARHGSLRLLGRCSGTLRHSRNSQKARRRWGEPTAGQSTYLTQDSPTAKPKRRSHAITLVIHNRESQFQVVFSTSTRTADERLRERGCDKAFSRGTPSILGPLQKLRQPGDCLCNPSRLVSG